MNSSSHPREGRWAGWWRSGLGCAFRFYADYFRWPVLLVVGALVVDKAIYYGVLPVVGYIAGQSNYFVARREFARGHDEAAMLALRAAMLHTREDVSFWKLAAQIAERLNSPDDVYCWQQVDRLEPGVPATQVAGVETAVRRGQIDLATALLDEVNADARRTSAFLRAAGEVAQATGDSTGAREDFTALEAMRPTDTATLFVLAQWHAATPEEIPQARKLLVALLARPEAKDRASRLLADLALKGRNFAGAKKWSDILLQSNHATISDRVQCLDILNGFSSPAAEAELAEIMRTEKPDEIVPVAEWMITHARAEPALIWIRTLPEELQDDPRIGIARADCLSALGLWDHLREIQAADTWPGHEPERLMYLARACSELQAGAEARAAWQQALLACRDYRDDIVLLNYLQSSRAVIDEDARALVLTQMMACYPDQIWVVRALLRDRLARHDSLQAEILYARLAHLDPNDPEAEANDALFCLLRGTRVEKASASLDRLLLENPADPIVATAAAYDLYRQGKFADALATIGALTPVELSAPERAVYLGALLAAAGPVGQARAHLAVALARPELLDEERALAARAKQLLDYRAAMAALLHGGKAVPLTPMESQPSGIFLVAQSVALVRSGAMPEAADLLATVDVSALDPAGLSIYLGGVLELAGRDREAAPYLELSPDLPWMSSSEKCRRALEAWWAWQSRAPLEPNGLRGLFAVYRGLDAFEADDVFWHQDESRQIELVRLALLRGVDIDEAQQRLHGLLDHVPFAPEIQAQFAYALLRQGQVLAARQSMEAMSPADRAQPELALYYGVILTACGERKAAEPYLRQAMGPALLPEERILAQQTEETP